MRRLLLSVAAACLALILGLRRRDHAPRPPVAERTASHESQAQTSISASTRPFAGFVVDEKGRAIAGANVCARVEGSFLADAERAALCVRTADDGLFSFSAPPRVLRLVASAPGYLPRTTMVEDLEHPASIALARGGAKVGGRIVDPLGRPVANARIESASATDALTDGDGVYELWTAPGVATLHVSADGYADRDIDGYAPSDGNDAKVEWGGTIVGRARPRAWVSTYEEHGGEKSVRADDTGAFRIAGLSSGRYVLEARSPGNYGRYATVTLGVGEVSNEIEIPLEPAHDVVVHFAECKNGSVRLFADRPHAVGTFAVLIGGTARLLSMPRGSYAVRVGCDDGVVAAKRDITVVDHDVEVTFAPDDGVSVRGVVVDRAGKRLPFAKVCARSSNAFFSETTADAKGAFRFAALPTASYTFSIEHPDAVDAAQSLHVQGSMTNVRFELDRGGTISGRAIDAMGRPVAGLRIDGGGKIARTAVDGRFTIAHVATGEHTLVATRGAQSLGTGTVTLEDGDTATLDLVVESEDGSITGTVVDAAGVAVVEALVEVGKNESPFLGDPALRTLTDAAGRFTVGGVPHGTYAIRATRRGHAPAVVEVETGTAAKLVLGAASSIAGTVALSAEESGYVWLTCKPVARQSTLIARDGTFAFEDLAEGTCTLDVNVGTRREKRTIVLKSGEIARPSF
jgi:protocatechuate 3,4-dioxygenase beta subunit